MPLHHHHAIHHKPSAIHRAYKLDIMAWPEGDDVPLTDPLRREYERFYTTVVIRPNKLAQVDAEIDRIMKGKDAHYLPLANELGVPWYVIGVIHNLECDCRFDCHLHNGNPLSRRTTDEPKNRPEKGKPPFTWAESAKDALKLHGFDLWPEWWKIGGTLYKLEVYNGMGPRNHGVASDYLWGGSTFYDRGRYVKDHLWDPKAQSDQIGAAVLLRRMASRGLITFPSQVGVN